MAALACAPEAHAADVHVDGRNAGAADGSAMRPHRTIGAAVSAAAPGDVIKIARGTYAESVVVTVDDLSLEGGYTGATGDVYAGGGSGDFATRNTLDPQTFVASSAGVAVFAFYDAGDSSLSGLVIRDGAQHGVLADGDPPSAHSLTVTRCTVEDSGSPSEDGGGIFADVPLTVRESVIRNNVGDRGAGIAADGQALRLETSLIENNVGWGDHGGGVYAYGDVHLIGNVIRGNRTGEGLAYGWGGGLIVFGSGTVAELRGNLVTGNRAPSKGSGAFIDDGAVATLVNELIVDNLCGSQGGAGLYVDGVNSTGSQATLVNVTIAGHACSGGNAIVLERSSTVTATSSIFWNNGGSSFRVDPGTSLTVSYSDVEEGWSGTGNISSDPMFASAAAGDYHLRSSSGRPSNGGECIVDGGTSPAIDAGNPAGAFGAEPQPNGGRVDMGAYGNTAQAGCDDTTSASVTTGVGAGGGSSSSATTTTGSGGGGGDGGAGSTSATTGAGGDGGAPTTSATSGAGGDGGAPTTSGGAGGDGTGGADAGAGGAGTSGSGTTGSGDGSSSSGYGSTTGSGSSTGTGCGGSIGPSATGSVASVTGAGGSGDGPVLGEGGDGGGREGTEDGEDGEGDEGDARTGCSVQPAGGSTGAPLVMMVAAVLAAARRRRR